MNKLHESCVDEALLVACLVEAMEMLAFVTPLPWDTDPPPVPAQPLLRVSISYHGSSHGQFVLAASRDLGQMLAENLLGTDASLEPFTAVDSLKELMNVTCGLYLRRWHGIPDNLPARNLPQMGIPQALALEDAQWQALVACPEATKLQAQGHALVLLWTQGAGA